MVAAIERPFVQRETGIWPLLRSETVSSIDGSLRDELLNEEIDVTLDYAGSKLALWRKD